MLRSEYLKNQIVTESAKLAQKNDGTMLLSDYTKEYAEQLEEGSYVTFLRSWLGYMIEQRSKEAAEIMKDLIKYGIAVRKERLNHE